MQQNVSLTYSALKWLLVVLLAGLSLNASADSKLYFIHSDHLGTPQVMTDASQRVVWKANYMPFGEAEVDEDPDEDGVVVEMPLRFPGQYFDKETGLHYNYYRDYDPSTGRYIQSDPIGLRGGINTYGYAYQNPIRYTDPTGQAIPLLIWGGITLGDALWAGAGIAATIQITDVLSDMYDDSRDDSSDDASDDSDSCEDDEDDCEKIRKDIDRFVEMLKKRYSDLMVDKLDLANRAFNENPGGDLDGCGTFMGHHLQYEAWQNGLRRLIQKANMEGCSYNPEADTWAYMWAPPWPGCW